jgi:hypothetical protein
MNFEVLEKEKYYDDLRSCGGMILDKYESPSGVYELGLFYAGEYPHGDSHHYCQIIDKTFDKVIWEYRKGDKIRQIVGYPWSPDNETVYFGLIENGNKIAKHDIKSEELKVIFKSKQNENRLNWIHFVPQSFNGVIINSNYWINKEEFVEYFVFINETEELIELKDFFYEKIYPCPSNVLDCIYVFGIENIYLFNVKNQRIIKKESLILLKAGFYPKYRPNYFPKTREIYLQLDSSTDEKFIRIN